MTSEESFEFEQPKNTPVYREGAGVLPILVEYEDGERSFEANYVVRGPDAPKMEEAYDTASGVVEGMDGHGKTQMKEGFAEIIAYDKDSETFYLPEDILNYTEIDSIDGKKASELIKDEEMIEEIFTDYTFAAMAENSPFVYNPTIKTYETGTPVPPPESEEIIVKEDEKWKTGIVREEGEGGMNSLEYITALPIKLQENTALYDGEAFPLNDLKKDNGEWNQDVEFLWLDRYLAGFEIDQNWNHDQGNGKLKQSGKTVFEGSNKEIVKQTRKRNGLKNQFTVKAEAFGINQLLEE